MNDPQPELSQIVSGKFGDDPVIVVGVHRSGTSMLSRLLQEMAGHLGADFASANCESLYFQRLNIQLMYDCAASWHDPAPMWEVLNNDQSLNMSVARLQSRLAENSATAFWGDDASLARSARFWGWKDPRNTVTLPVWRRVFPAAKIVYIVRNGVDVAWSLVKRDRRSFRSRIRTALKNSLAHVLPHRYPEDQLRRLEKKPRPFTMEEAFALWNEYLCFADFNTRELPDASILRLRYEDLLIEPLSSLRLIDNFVGAGSADRALEEIAGRINARRRFAFVTDARLCDFYRRHCDHPQMLKHGYDRILDQSVSSPVS